MYLGSGVYEYIGFSKTVDECWGSPGLWANMLDIKAEDEYVGTCRTGKKNICQQECGRIRWESKKI